MSDSQPREPSGTPAGGRFSALRRDESGAVLMAGPSVEEWNANGSYRYPPNARDPEQAIHFWLNVPIPDSAIAKVVSAHWARYRQRKEWAEGRTYLKKLDSKKTREEKIAAETAKIGTPLYTNYARDVVRLAKLYQYANLLSQADRDEVRSTPFQIPGSSHLTTPTGVWEFYEFEQISSCLDPPDDAVATLEQIQSVVERAVRPRVPMIDPRTGEVLGYFDNL